VFLDAATGLPRSELLACSAFTRVSAYRLAESPTATLSIGGFSGFVTSAAAPIATGWSEPVPGRDFHRLKISAFHGAQLVPFCPDADIWL